MYTLVDLVLPESRWGCKIVLFLMIYFIPTVFMCQRVQEIKQGVRTQIHMYAWTPAPNCSLTSTQIEAAFLPYSFFFFRIWTTQRWCDEAVRPRFSIEQAKRHYSFNLNTCLLLYTIHLSLNIRYFYNCACKIAVYNSSLVLQSCSIYSCAM